MVEFALVLPLLLILLLGIADFGRVFAAAITIQAGARDAAEVAAQDYLRNPPGSPPRAMTEPAPRPGDPDYSGDTYYPALHALAAQVACRELRLLPNTTYVPDDPLTIGNEEMCFEEDPSSPDDPQSMPLIMICVHDDVDPYCADAAFGETIPADDPCSNLRPPPANSIAFVEAGPDPLETRYVEVRVCYRFTTLFEFLSIGDIYLKADHTFAIGFDPPPPTPEPPTPPPAPSSVELPTPSPDASAEPSAEASGSPN